MNDQIHVGTFLWGVILTVAGSVLAAVGFGWWDISPLDFRYAGPALVILIGLIVLTGALVQGRRAARTERNT